MAQKTRKMQKIMQKTVQKQKNSMTEKNEKAGKRREIRGHPNKSVAPSPIIGTTREEHACPRQRERRDRSGDSEGEEEEEEGERQQSTRMASRIAPIAPQPRTTPMDAPTASSTAAATLSTSSRGLAVGRCGVVGRIRVRFRVVAGL